MVQYFDKIPPNVLKFIAQQHLFYVATAPLTPDGHVNLSPKGYDTFHIVNENQVWYEDLTGSGVETIAHLKENGRITIMFVAFEGPPNIVRLFGKGTVHEFGTTEYDRYIPPTNRKPGSRAVLVVDIYQVSTSCGYGVPLFKYERERSTLLQCFSARESFDAKDSSLKTERGLKAYWRDKNAYSLDGITGLTIAGDSDKPFLEENHIDTKGWFPVPDGKKGVVMPPPEKNPATSTPGQESSVTVRKDWIAGFVAGVMLATVVCTTLTRRL